MIRPIDIKLNAAHPELPLMEATTYTNSPSAVFVRGVPRKCGTWEITSVYVSVTFPDSSATTHTAALAANGIWVATFGGTATAGRTTNGLRILADGTDENGDAVTGYVLGVADFAVLSLASSPAPETTTYAVRFLPDGAPETPQTGDLWLADGLWYVYDGTSAVALSAVTSVNGETGAVVLTGEDIAVSAEDATKVDAAIAAKYTKPASGIPASDLASGVIPTVPVQSVNSKTGAVVLDAADVGAVATTGGTMTGDLTIETGNTLFVSMIDVYSGVIQIGLSGRIAQQTAAGLLSDTYLPNYGEVKSALPYSQTLTTLAAGTTALALTDRAAPAYDMTALDAGDSVAVTLPTITSGKTTDVVLTIKTGAAVPALTFDANTTFISADSSWGTLTESAYNVITFTSSGFADVWIVGRITQAIS